MLSCEGLEQRLSGFCLAWQVAQEIWVVGNNTVSKWQGTIEEYKEHLKATHEALHQKETMTER